MNSPVQEFAQPSIRLLPSDKPIKAGCSKFGGLPDAPVDFVWPESHEGPLSFICQVRLNELATANWTGLPAEGLLSFFYDLENQPWGFDPKNREGFKVFYYADVSALRPHALPDSLNADYQVREKAFDWKQENTYPAWGADELEGLPDLDFDKVDDLLQATCGKEPYHRMFGHAQIVQNEMRIECQLVSNGIYMGGGMVDTPEAQALARHSHDWILLLQIDFDEELQTEFGDSGRIYYWIRKQDLAVRAFDKVWLILQCY